MTSLIRTLYLQSKQQLQNLLFLNLRNTQTYLCIVCLVLLIIISTTIVVPVQAQNLTGQITGDVNSSVEIIDAKRNKITELRKLKAELEKKNTALTLEIVEHEDKIAIIKAQSIRTGEDINEITVQLEGLDKNLETINKDIAAKKAEKEANTDQINKIDEEIKSIQTDLDNEVNQFRGEIVNNGAITVSFLLLIVGYWIAYEILYLLIKRFAPKEWHGISRFLLIVTAFIASIITVFVALAARLDFLLASIGVISAALVVALQDMVSSFFGWILINTQNQYKEGHIIRIGQDTDAITGVVTHIGFLRTYMNERVGIKSDLDSEQSTGKILSFPNNQLFTKPLVNFSVNDQYLWYSFNLTITFESDEQKAFIVMEDYMNHWYETESDIRGIKQRILHQPKVYVSIADDGPKYTVWFSAKIGAYRTTLNRLSLGMLEELRKNKIELAYKTVRTVGNLDIAK